MVGHRPLEAIIGVRVPDPQLDTINPRARALGHIVIFVGQRLERRSHAFPAEKADEPGSRNFTSDGEKIFVTEPDSEQSTRLRITEWDDMLNILASRGLSPLFNRSRFPALNLCTDYNLWR